MSEFESNLVPSRDAVETILKAGTTLVRVARAGLSQLGFSPVASIRNARRAAAKLENALNPDRVSFDDWDHRSIRVEGWNPEVSLGLLMLRAAFHDMMARWEWCELADGKDPETLQLVVPHHVDRLAELEPIETGLSLIQRGLDADASPGSRAPDPAPADTAPSGTATPKVKAREGRPSARNRALAAALKMVREGEPLVLARIADRAGCSERYLHKCHDLKAFIAANRRMVPRGRKDRDTGAIDVEDWPESDG